MPNMPHYKHWNENDTCETVGTKTLLNNYGHMVELYPNPANGIAIISVPEGKQGFMRLVNAFGQAVKEQKITSPQTTINLGLIPVGIYYVNIQFDDGQRVILKLVVSK